MSKQVLDGNANAMEYLAQARKTAKQLGIDSSPIIEEMTNGDYDKLKEVFLKHFGEYFTFSEEEDEW